MSMEKNVCRKQLMWNGAKCSYAGRGSNQNGGRSMRSSTHNSKNNKKTVDDAIRVKRRISIREHLKYPKSKES